MVFLGRPQILAFQLCHAASSRHAGPATLRVSTMAGRDGRVSIELLSPDLV